MPNFEPSKLPLIFVAQLCGGASAQVEHAAVVAGENHKRIVGDPFGFEGCHDFADDPVEFMHEVAIDSAIAGPLKPLGRSKWMMHIGGG